MNKRYALLSVFDKTGIEEIAQELVRNSIEIISSGGTAKYLQEKGFSIIPIEKITHSPESFDGRMKTISFQVASGILYDRNNKAHVNQAKVLAIPSIDFVICNVYPFWDKPGIEMIDVGGPTMIRAAAKNYDSVTVVTDPKDYVQVIKELKKNGQTTLNLRRSLAAKAFAEMASYDILISNYFQKNSLGGFISLQKGQQLRYGDNPHQKGYFFKDGIKDTLGLGNFHILQGKESSYTNYLDVNAGLEALALLNSSKPVCIILKHNNPCGAAEAATIEKAFTNAWYKGDSLAAFGGIVIVNRPVTKKVASVMLKGKKFIEMVVAPEFSKDAREYLAQKPRLQLWANSKVEKIKPKKFLDIKKIRGGYLVQEGNMHQLKKSGLSLMTKKKPTKKQIDDMLFAWVICQVSKSNCVAVVKNRTLLSSGVGQQDRKRCCELCVSKATVSLKNSVAASDGFFPFADGPEVLVKAGVTAIIQPGGSIKDKDVVDFANKAKITMVATHIRAFKH